MTSPPDAEWPSAASRASVPSGRRYRVTTRGKVVFTLFPIAVFAGLYAILSGGDPPQVAGIEDGALLNAEQAESVRVTVVPLGEPADAVGVTVDGEPVPVQADGDRALAVIGPLSSGDHEMVVVVDRGALRPDGRAVVGFSVDDEAPTLEVQGPLEPQNVSDPVVLRISVDDPAASVEVGDRAVDLDDGVAELRYERAPRAPVEVRAVDEVGNVGTLTVQVPLALAGEPGQPPMRGVHASGWTWATPELRDPILAMVEEGLINTVQLDLKDEGGDVWYDTEVAFAHEIGAVTELWDLPAVVDDLHDRGVRVVGRIVNFRDPRLAGHAAATGDLDLVVQNPDGSAYGKYGGFANPFSEEVWEYNIQLAEEAARLGVDDILYDYVRRPDDDIEGMVFPGQDGAPEDAVVEFLEESRTRVHAAGARLGASVFGIAATRPDEVAQDIPRMAEHADYIAPMVYPSHWGPGEYGVADPNSQPYDIVHRSLQDFVEQLDGSGAHVVAWLQDFSLGVDYGVAEVAAQIEASLDAGVHDILLWDAATTYTADALRD